MVKVEIKSQMVKIGIRRVPMVKISEVRLKLKQIGILMVKTQIRGTEMVRAWAKIMFSRVVYARTTIVFTQFLLIKL